jgi:hypothetical protein
VNILVAKKGMLEVLERMEPIYPLHEEVVSRYCGMPVCAVMQDGSRYIGILSSCKDGKLCLNGEPEASSDEAQLNKAKSAVSKKTKGGKNKKEAKPISQPVKAQTQAYPYDPYGYGYNGGYGYGYGPQPYNPWGGALALDFALIAFLFLLL